MNYVTHWIDWNNQIRPRPAAGHGPLRGLRFSVKLQKIPPYVNAKSGVVVSFCHDCVILRTIAFRVHHFQVMIGDPSGFPFENDLFVPSGKRAEIGVSGDTLITTKRLERLAIAKRSCLFPHEKRVLHRGYLRQNCIANCYRSFVQSRCKCYLDFIYYQISTVCE